MSEKERKGRGPGRTPNPRFSMSIENPESVVGTIPLKIKGREEHPLTTRHLRLLSMARYCELRNIFHHWYPATLAPECEERVLYLRVPADERFTNTIKREASRRELSLEDRERVVCFPLIKPVEAPTVEREEGVL